MFAGDSEMRDLILASHGAIMSDRKIQDRIQDFRTGMLARISQGDTILPRELETSRAMAQPWLFDAVIAGMKKINETGTGAAEAGKQTYYDTVFGKLSKEQQETLSMITMDNNSVAYQKIMAEILGIGRYPATSRSARTAENVLAGNSEKAKAMRAALEKSGFDPNAMYISPSSPLMTLLQDADFDGDVMDLIGLVYSGQDKNGPKLRAAEVFNRVYQRGMAKIDSMGLSEEDANARKDQFSKAVFGMESFSAQKGLDIMKVLTPAMQGGYFMGGPDAVVRNAMQIPWTESVRKAIADAESQYSVNSVRNKKGMEMITTPEQMELLSKYRTFTEFFHAVNKHRDEFGNVDIPGLAEAMKGSDGLSGAKFWATNLPFHTMSSNVRTMMLSRYFAKQRGIDINEGYDWNYIFDSILGKKNTDTALGRMQAGLRDAWMGFLDADYLAMDEASVAKLAELRKLAIEEEAAKVQEERHRQGSASFGKKGSNRSIAEHLVDRLGGTVIKNAAAGMVMSESHLEDEGMNKGVFDLLKALNMPDIVGGIDLSKLLAMKTTPQTFEEMSATTKSTQLARVLGMFNLLTQREKQNRIDNMPRLSFSTLAKLAYSPEEFMKDIVTGRENSSSLAATEIGQGAHTAIEHFMRARMSGAFYKKDGTVDEEGLKKAQEEALTVFDQYLGVKKAPAGFKREGRGLTDVERAEMLTPGNRLNERYERLRSFFTGDSLLKIFPEKDWEVVGIESSNVGNNGEKTPAGNMKIPGKGKKILNPSQDVEMTGSYDLLFRHRKDGRIVMGDIKNYWEPTVQDWQKWKVQQAIYASQLKKNGFQDVSSTIIEPYFSRIRNMGFTEYDFAQSDENVAKAVKAIQGLAKNGDTTVQDVYDAARFVRQTLFGEVETSIGDKVAERYNKYTRGGKRGGGTSLNPGIITDALWMHDRYKEAVENDEDIHKFINKEIRSKDSVFTSDMAWKSKFDQARAIHEAATQQEIAGRTAEAKDLEARYEAAIRDLDNNMGVAIVGHISDFADNVRSAIDGQSGTKQVQETIKAYKNTKTQQSGLEKSISLFQDRIKETKGREEALQSSIDEAISSDKNIAKDQDVYDRLIQYTKEALGQTEDTKNISARAAAGKRAARTKLLNANAHIRDNSIFSPVLVALANGDEEQAIKLMEHRKGELSNLRKDTQAEIERKKAEKEGERFQGAMMSDQLLKAQDLLATTAPLTDIYLNQLKKSAMTSLEDSFISLAGITDKKVGKPFSTSKARTDFINMVGNSLQDASSLFEAGMISESDLARYKAQADTLMQEDNLSKVEQAAIDEAKRKLGMKTETTNEQRERWLKDRQQVLEAERDLKKRDARRETIDAYKEARKNNQYVRPIDYKTKIDEQNTKIDEQYEQEFAKIEEDRKDLEKQNELARQQRLDRLDYQNRTAQEQRQRAYEQQLRSRWGQPRSRVAAAYLQQDNLRLGLIKTAEDNEFAAQQAKDRLASYNKSFAAKYGRSYSDYKNLSDQEKDNIAGDHAKDAQSIAEATRELTRYEQAAKDAREQSQKFTPVMMGMSAGFQGVSQTVGMLFARFGRQTFYRILNETKQFIKQFDASMNEIQAITLKSDNQMQDVRSRTIATALEMKTSVSNVASVEAALYRQGLNDNQVQKRTESIIKFATVTKLKTEEATKIITTALQNNLVGSADEAMDALVALGDKAATTAAEIGKGMQKAAASAKVAGVSYSELTALLTIGTSDTQLSGTQVGTALQTVFSRMRKLTLSGYTADQSGKKTTASDAEAALRFAGVELWDDKAIGKMRSAYDVLLDLSKVWSTLNDAQKGVVTSAMAGTRQTNIFSTLMEGMAEDGGATLEKYLDLAENSEGITQSKYEIAMQSLSASLNEMKASWDAVVEGFTNSGAITGALDGISGFLQLVAGLSDTGLGQISVVFSTIAGGITALTAACVLAKTAVAPVASLLSLIAGLAVGGLGIAAFSGLDALFNPESNEEKLAREREEAAKRLEESSTLRKEFIGKKENAVENVEKYGKAFDKLKDTQDEIAKSKATEDLINSLTSLGESFPNLDGPIDDAISHLDKWSDAIKAAKKEIDGLKEENDNTNVSNAVDFITQHGDSLYSEYLKNYNNKKGRLTQEDKNVLESGFRSTIWGGLTTLKTDMDFLNREDILSSREAKLAYFNELTLDNEKAEILGRYISNIPNKALEGATSLSSAYLTAKNTADRANALTDDQKVKVVDNLLDYFFESAVLNDVDAISGAGYDKGKQYKTSEGLFMEEAKTVALGYIKELIPNLHFEDYATEKFGADYVSAAFLNGIRKELNNPNSEYAFINSDGTVNNKAISLFFENMFKGKSTEQRENEIGRLLTRGDYLYHFDTGKGENDFVGFTDYSDALKYAKANGISMLELKDKDNNVAYQSSDKVISALFKQNEETGKNGQLVEFVDLLNRKNINSISDLEHYYDVKGLSSELSAILGNNPDLLGSYWMAKNGKMSWEDFSTNVQKLKPGREGLGSELVDAIMSIAYGDRSFIEQLRTNPNLEGVYKAFKTIVGDSADAVLTAIEDGVNNPDAMKQFSKGVVQQRIKDSMQFNKYYESALAYATTALTGTRTEQLSSNATIKTETQSYYDYIAAVQRYANGTAKSTDYATIAAYDKSFTETQLKNGVSSEQLLTNAKSYQNGIIEQNQAYFDAVIRGALGENAKYSDLNKQVTTSQIDQYLATLDPQIREAIREDIAVNGMTQRQFVGAMGYEDSFNYWENNSMFAVDENGELHLKNQPEEKLTAKAIRDAYKQNISENDLSEVYQGIASGAWTGEGAIASKFGTEKLAKLIETDYGMLRNAGASRDEIMAWAQAQAEGRQLLATEGWQKGWADLFGGQNITAENIAGARAKIASSQDSERTYYEAFLNAIPPDMKELITSGEQLDTQTAEDVIKKYGEWLAQQTSLKGLRDAAEIAANQSVLTTGNAAERLALQSQFGSTMSEAQQAQYILSQGDISQASTLAKYLDMTEEQVRTAMSAGETADLTNALDVLQREQLDKIARSYGYTDDITKGTMKDNIAALRAYAKENGKTDLENLLNAYDENGNLIGVDNAIMRMDFSKQYTKAESARLAREAFGSGLSFNEAQRKYNAQDWAAIENYSPELARYMKMSDAQRQSVEGQNLKRSIEIQFKVTGVQDLEEAGIVAQGTADAVERLSKGGKEAIDELNKISTEAYSSGQQRAKLLSGSRWQKAEAAMAYLGITDENEYYADEENLYQRALEAQQAQDIVDANKLQQEYMAADEKGKVRIIEDARKKGFSYQNLFGMPLFVPTSTPKISKQSLISKEPRYTNTQLADFGRQIMSSGLSWEDAVNSGILTDEQFAALKSANPDIEKYLSWSSAQRGSLEGQNLKRKIDIELEVAGLKDLEEAGQLLEGTSAMVENLKKGGRFEIEAIVKIRQEAHSESQISAALASGTIQQQREAITQLTGATMAQVMNEPERWRAEAEKEDKRRRAERAKALTAERAGVSEAELAGFDSNALEEGYEWVSDYLLPEGYQIKNGEVYTLAGAYDRIETNKYKKFGKTGHYVDKGAPAVDFYNELLNEASTYTKKETQDALNQILNRTFVHTNENDALYKAAYNSAGAYTQQLIKRIEQGQYVSDSLRTASANERRNEPTFTEEDYDLSTASGAFQYYQLNREQNNKTALAANSLFQTLSSGRIKTVEDLANSVNKSDVDNWSELLANSEELSKTFDDLGIKVGDNGQLDFSAVENSAGGLASALSALSTIIAGLSTDYEKHEVQSTGETYQYATDLLNGTISETDFQKGYAALAEVTGNQQYADYIASEFSQWTAANDQYNKYQLLTLAGKYRWLQANGGIAPEKPGEWAPHANIQSSINKDYVDMLYENASYGGHGISDIQRYDKLMEMIGLAGQGGTALADYRQGDMFGAFNDYIGMQGIEGADKWFQMAERAGAMNLDINKIGSVTENSADYEKWSKVFEGIVDNVGEAVELNRKFMQSVALTGRQLKNSQTNLDAYATGYKKYSKNAKEASSATADYTQRVANISKRQFARNQFKKNGTVTDELASMMGYSSKKEAQKKAKENKEQFLKDLELFDDADKQEMSDIINGEVQGIIDQAIQESGNDELKLDMSMFKVSPDGSVDFDLSAIESQLGSQAAIALAALAATLAGQGIEWKAEPYGNGADGGVKIVVSDLGKGSKGGGSGGGGNKKSATDKLLEKQKRKLAELQHEAKMLEIQEKGYEYNNDYSGWQSNINDQIAAQERLRKQYAKNIEELEKMLKKVKKGSDDYNKLKEAIQQAQEALAEINNTINELKMKDITIAQQRIDNRTYPKTHRTSMLEMYAQNAVDKDKFKDYVELKNQSIESKRDEIKNNNKSIDDWKKLLKDTEQGTKKWDEIRQKIYELEEQNAQLENEVLEEEQELFRWRLSNVAQILQQNSQALQHRSNVAETYAGTYQTLGYRNQYNDMIKEQIKANEGLIKKNKEAEASAKQMMSEVDKGSTLWYEAQAAMFSAQETIASTTVAIMELNHALAESDLEGIKEIYDWNAMDIDHTNEMLQSFGQNALDRNDYQAYYEAMNQYVENLNSEIPLVEQKLNSLTDTYNEKLASDEGLSVADQVAYLEAINEAELQLFEKQSEIEKTLRETTKTRIDEMLAEQNRNASDFEHNQRLLGYQSSKYQSSGELTNYSKSLEADNELRRNHITLLEAEQLELKDWLNIVEKGSKEEERINEALKKNEEQIEENNKQIANNTKLIDENEKKIRQLRKTLEDSVDKEIEAEKKRNREILAANVSMQNSILDVLKKRLQEEWNLKKKDIEKEKEALNEYKRLINERFNYRKKASQQADKDEELADYRRQLALIEADPTRTKDAKELRRKIEELEKDRAWTIAEDELNLENQRVDDQMQAMDKYVQYNEQLLNQILGDANNFSDEVSELLTGTFQDSYDKVLQFMKQENDAFAKSLPEAQQQMIQSLEDQMKKAKDVIDSNYEKIVSILVDKDTYLTFMKGTDQEYRKAYEHDDYNTMAILERTWIDKFDDYEKSMKDTFTFEEHLHVLNSVDSHLAQLEDTLFDIDHYLADGFIGGEAEGPYGLYNKGDDVTTQDFSTGNIPTVNDYSNVGKKRVKTKYKPIDGKEHSITYVYDDGSTENGGKEEHKFDGNTCTKCGYKKKSKNDSSGSGSSKSTKWSASVTWYKGSGAPGGTVTGSGIASSDGAAKKIAQKNAFSQIPKTAYNTGATSYKKIYKTGGLVDYTGLAWVDGSTTRPEAFLSAIDTKNIRSMLDMFNYVLSTPYMSNYDPSAYGNTTNIGDINITINEAELASDADVNKLAKQVGQAFSRELQRNGLNLSGYSFG